MGRPRKQPRRIMTFNLNVPLADAIDALPVKNRSEWMNNVLPDVLEDRDSAENLRRGGERALESIDEELLFLAADSAGIMDTFSDARLIVALLVRYGVPANALNMAAVSQFLQGKRPRKPFSED